MNIFKQRGSKAEVVEALMERFIPTPLTFTKENKVDWIKSLAPDIVITRDSFDQIEDIIITGKSGKKHTISLQGYGEGVRVFIDDTHIGIGG
jgi:hypothetical protein